MNFARCYTRNELKDYLLGKLSEIQSDLVSEHLSECNICEDTVVGLDNESDTFVKQLCGAPGAELAIADPMVHKTVERAKKIGTQSWKASSSPENANSLTTLNQVGDYELLEQLGAGGMGSVYRARHCRLEKEVALKLLPDRRMRSGDAISRFHREMKIIGQMDHPNMVQATDAGQAGDVHYLVMELIDGLNLSQVVRTFGQLRPADACEIVRQAAIVLHYAHEQGVIHRDIKPSNLMLTRTGHVKLLDLGLATLGGLEESVDELTTVGQLMGTLDYMAPEQCGDDHAVDERSDIYGLASTLYKLLTGAAPYTHPNNNTALKKLKAMATTEPTPVRVRRDDLNRELSQIVERCLSRDPGERPGSAEQLAELLHPYSRDSDLPKLFDEVEKRYNDGSINNTHRDVIHTKANAKPANKTSKTDAHQPESQIETRTRKRNSLQIWLVAAALMGVLIWGGVTIILNTGSGQLIIESESDNVEVTLLKDGNANQELKINHGSEMTQLRSGRYKIEIRDPSDQLEIDKNQFVIRRGSRVVAKITQKGTSKSQSENMLTDHDENLSLNTTGQQPPTYDGFSLEKWVNHAITQNATLQPNVVNMLVQNTDTETLSRIVNRWLKSLDKEMSVKRFRHYALCLYPMCKTQETMHQLVTKISSVVEYHDLARIEKGDFSMDRGNQIGDLLKFETYDLEQEKLLIEEMRILLTNGKPKYTLFVLKWLESNYSRIDSSMWSRPLFSCFTHDEPVIRLHAVNFTTRHFQKDPNFTARMEPLLLDDDPEVSDAAISYFTSFEPDNARLIETLRDKLVREEMDWAYAIVKASSFDKRLEQMIIEKLSDADWGMPDVSTIKNYVPSSRMVRKTSTAWLRHKYIKNLNNALGGSADGGSGNAVIGNMLGAGGGGESEDFTVPNYNWPRVQLIDAIGRHKEDNGDKFLPLLKKELKTSDDAGVLDITWFAIDKITGQETPTRFGRSVEQWIETLSTGDEEQKFAALESLRSLSLHKKKRESICRQVLIAMRQYSVDLEQGKSVDLVNEAIEVIVASIAKNKTRDYHNLSSFNNLASEFTNEDAMFVLLVCNRSKDLLYHGNIRLYLLRCIVHPNKMVAQRAVSLAANLTSSSRSEQSNWESRIAEYFEAYKDDKKALLFGIKHAERDHSWVTAKRLALTDDPQALATLIDQCRPHKKMFDLLAEIMINNKTDFEESVESFDLSVWEDETSNTESKSNIDRLIERLLEHDPYTEATSTKVGVSDMVRFLEAVDDLIINVDAAKQSSLTAFRDDLKKAYKFD